jgi:hypothetical protein
MSNAECRMKRASGLIATPKPPRRLPFVLLEHTREKVNVAETHQIGHFLNGLFRRKQ